MGKRTGNPRGRPKGSKNKHTKEREQAMQQAAEDIATALALDAFGGDAHALLMAIYKDEKRPIELRLEAAKAAIGYEKPRLATVEAKFDGTIEYYTAQPIPVEQRETDRLYQQTTGE